MSAPTVERLRRAGRVTWAAVSGFALGSPVGIALGITIGEVLR